MTTAEQNASPSRADQAEDDQPLTLPVHLTPEEIKVRKELNLRKFKTAESEQEEENEIKALAISMLTEGQLENLLVREEKGPKNSIEYSLVAGSRRRRAALLINSGAIKSLYDPKKKGPFMLECKVVDKDDKSAKRAAIHENIKRKNFSPMNLLMLIEEIRDENGWQGKEHTQKVADYFGVSQATITQHERLGECPKKIKDQVHSGELGVDAALAILKVKDEEVESVMADAKKRAKKEAEDRLEKSKGKVSNKQKEELKKSAEKPTVSKKHVVAAARDKKALKKGEKEPRSKKEILEVFESLAGPASPPVMAEFARYLTEKFAKGAGTEGTLIAKWDAIAELIPASKQGKTTAKGEAKGEHKKAA